jgi:hypothetical protein
LKNNHPMTQPQSDDKSSHRRNIFLQGTIDKNFIPVHRTEFAKKNTRISTSVFFNFKLISGVLPLHMLRDPTIFNGFRS